MPSEVVRPTSNVNSGWGAGGDYTYVDDAVSQPSAGSGDTATYSGDSSAIQQWGCAAPSNSGTISATSFIFAQRVVIVGICHSLKKSNLTEFLDQP